MAESDDGDSGPEPELGPGEAVSLGDRYAAVTDTFIHGVELAAA